MTEDQEKKQAGPDVTAPSEDTEVQSWAETTEPETKLETEQASKPEDKDDFQQFYVEEARRSALGRGILYLLFIVFGVGLIGFVVEAFVDHAPYRLETSAALVICLALLAVLWKKVSWEVKVGLEVVCLGFLSTLAHAVYGVDEFSILGIPATLVQPLMLCLAMVASLVAFWSLRPKKVYLPAALTVLTLYAGLSPLLSAINKAAGLGSIFLGPGAMENWPIFIRPGWLLAQVVLPIGALFFLILQFRTLLKKQYESHWGHIYWAVFLALTSTIGLAVVERAGEPAFPNMDSAYAKIYSVDRPAPPAQLVQVEQTAPVLEPAEPTPAEESQVEPEPVAQDAEQATETPVVSEPPVQAETKQETADVPAEPPKDDKLVGMQKKIDSMQTEIESLKRRLVKQEELIRSLFDYLGSGGGAVEQGPTAEEGPSDSGQPQDEGAEPGAPNEGTSDSGCGSYT